MSRISGLGDLQRKVFEMCQSPYIILFCKPPFFSFCRTMRNPKGMSSLLVDWIKEGRHIPMKFFHNIATYECTHMNIRGGSGLAVLGPPPSSSNRGPAGVFDNIVQRASNPSQAEENLGAGEAGRRLVTMYRNGFTVDDGPLRDLASPESRAFLASLERGEAPVGTNLLHKRQPCAIH
jgi:hypothetical protein